MPTKTPATKLLTKPEATKLRKRILSSAESCGNDLIEYHDRDGWRAEGYASFKEACEKGMAEIFGSRSTIYRLMQQAAVSANVSQGRDTVELPQTQAAALATLPAAEQREAFAEAAATSGNGAAATAAVVAAVDKRTTKKAANPVAEKPNEKHENALVRIGAVCGKPVRASIEKGTLPDVTAKEAIFWAGLTDAQMADIETLVVTKRWKPSAAHRFVTKMVTPKTRIADLINLAIAGDGSWEGTFSGYVVTVKGRTI